MTIKKFLIILTVFSSWFYIYWRVFYTVPNGFAKIFGIILLIAEILQLIQSTIFNILIYNPPTRKSKPLMNNLPTVDVLIATYNEPIDVIKRTSIGCLNLEYPKELLKIWICDDGRRESIKKLANELEIGYICRPTNEHAKAGNLNNALKQTNSELTVTMDADMIPKPNFLNKTVGFFIDKNLAYVQVPQSFFDQDVFQYNLYQEGNIPNDQDVFMRLIQAGRDKFNSTIYIGSNTIFRRTALDSVNGFAVGSITEDMATGMLLQAKGYNTIFFNEILAQGLSPGSLSDFFIQRSRWARGNIQILKKWNPLFLRGFSFMQRVLYLTSIFYWYNGLLKMIFIMSPLLFLLFDIPILNATLHGILIYWLPQFILSGLILKFTTNNMRDNFWSNIYDTATAPILSLEALKETFMKKPIGFKVTPKDVLSTKIYFQWKLMLSHIILLILSILAIIKGTMFIASYGMTTGIFINLFWIFYNIIGLIGSILLGWERPRQRKTERFIRSYPIIIKSNNGQKIAFGSTMDVSEKGCKVFFNKLNVFEGDIKIIIINEHNENFEFDSKLIYYSKYDKGYSKAYQAAFEFKNLSLEQYKNWVKELYGKPVNDNNFKLQSGSSGLRMFLNFIFNFRFQYKRFKVRD